MTPIGEPDHPAQATADRDRVDCVARQASALEQLDNGHRYWRVRGPDTIARTSPFTRYGHLGIYDDDGYVGLATNVTTKGD